MAIKRASAGAVLALGAPLGWIAVDFVVNGISPLNSILTSMVLYSYMTFATIIVFTLLGFYLGNLEDQLEDSNQRLKEANIRIEGSSRTDQLTGHYNTSGFMELLKKWTSFHRHSGNAASLITVGYREGAASANGDAAARLVGSAIKIGRRHEDVVGRLSENEFAVFLPSVAKEGAYVEAEKILGECKRMVDRMQGVEVEFYVGLTPLHRNDESKTLLRRAEKALKLAMQQNSRVPVALEPPEVAMEAEVA